MKLFLIAFFGIIFAFLQQAPAFADLSYSIHETARMASVNRDFETSFKLYYVLAKHGNGNAQMRVSQFYADGEGVKQDYVQAYMWGRVLSNGPKSDQQISGMMTTIKASMNKYLSELATKMSSEQVQEAERLAREWKPSETLEVTPEIAKLLGPEYQDESVLEQAIERDAESFKRKQKRLAQRSQKDKPAVNPKGPSAVMPTGGPPIDRFEEFRRKLQQGSEQSQKEFDERKEREKELALERDKACFEQARNAAVQSPTEAQQPVAGAAGFDELKMQRLGCYGSCPTYDLTIKEDGRLWYQGNGYVDTLGLVKTTLSKDQLGALAGAIKQANFPAISKLDFSGECRTDAATTVISLTIGCNKYVTNHYYGGCLSSPEVKSLTQLEQEIDKILKVEQWAGSSQTRNRELGRSLSVQDQIRRFIGMAEEGDVTAQKKLATVYTENCGERGYAEAVKWWIKAAEQDDGQAQNMLADAYASGKGVKQNYQIAIDWLKKSAEKEYSNPDDYQRIAAAAQNHLGYLYERGNGVPQDKAEAYYWFMRAADNLNVQDGYSGQKEQSNNKRRLLDQSMPELMQATRKRVNSAKNSLMNRAEQGDAIAQYGLGLIYYHGEGIQKSFTEALKWLRKSSEQGYRDAQVSLGLLYASEQEGVPYEPSEAVFWLQLGKGDAGAKYMLERELKRMTDAQIQDINKRISEWKPIQAKPAVVATPPCNAKEIPPQVP